MVKEKDVKELWQIIMKLCRLCICMQYYSTTLELIGEDMDYGRWRNRRYIVCRLKDYSRT